MVVAWPLAANWPPSNDPICSTGTRPGIVCIRLNWLRLALGRPSISELVTLVPIRLDVVSTIGLWPVTTSDSTTPATCNVTLIVSSWPTFRTSPVSVVN